MIGGIIVWFWRRGGRRRGGMRMLRSGCEWICGCHGMLCDGRWQVLYRMAYRLSKVLI